MKDIVILGGPNGAGKTTAAQILLPVELNIREFVNADEIAKGLSPFNVEKAAILAGRIMLARLRELVASGESFAFETTCAGRNHARWLAECKSTGWRIALLYLWLPSSEMALARVARRVAEGGHAIPPEVVVRRYAAGVRNMLGLYLPLADSAAIYDNADNALTLIANRLQGRPLVVNDPERWACLEEASR